MPRKGSPYGASHERERVRLLGGGRARCVYCSAPATEADHVPPLSLHRHRAGSGCCRLVPACGPCQRRQGGLLRARQVVGTDPEALALLEPVGFDVLDPVWDVPWLDDLREVPENAVWPRLMTVPHPSAVGSLGADYEAWCADVRGVTLRWWQRLVARRRLEVDAGGRLVWLDFLESLARQLGKSTELSAFFAWRLTVGFERFGERQTLLYTARDLGVSREVQFETRMWARDAGDVDDEGELVRWYKVTEANGKEAIEHLRSHSRWLLRAEDNTFGVSATSAVVDEGWDVKASTVDNGVAPTVVEHEQPQLGIVSTAHSKATALVLGRRAAALAALDSPDAGLIIEWSAPRDVDITDRSGWRMASPHWSEQRERMIEGLVNRALAGESVDDLESDPVEAVRTQWLNIWPAVGVGGGKGELLVDREAWRAAVDESDVGGSLVLAVEDWFGQGAAVAAAGVTPDGVVVVGGHCFEARSDAFGWLRHWAEERPGSVLLVGASLAGDSDVDEVSAHVEKRGTSETRSALSMLRTMLAGGVLRHDGGADVREHVERARVTRTAAGALALVPVGRPDLVRAVAWAVEEAARGLDSGVFVDAGGR